MFAASKTSTAVSAAEADPFFTNVTALVNTSGTNGAQNNTFIDSSTNNFTITRNGNTTQGTFSSFGENWSNFFPGSGEVSLRVPDSDAFWFDAQDFTLETWVFLSAKQSFNIFQQSNGTTGNVLKWSWWFNNSTNNLILSGHNPATSPLTWATRAWTPVVGKWYHLAVSKQSNSFRMFVDGVELGTANTVTTALPQVTSELYISDFKDAPVSAPRELAGYFSNMRIVKGTALYTANFTPSTVPLQPVAGTSLLTCQSPSIVDDSPNQFTITRNGDARVQKFGPFAGTTLPTPYYGAYFDGSGDVLTLGSNAALAFATGNFTLEMWYYTTVTPTATNVCPYNNGSGNFFLQIRNTAFGIGVVGSAENNAFSFNFVAGQWYHVAVAREGSTVRGFVDGTLVGTGSNSINYGQNGATIGGLTSSSQLITGHLSNLRVVKGQALYTSSFTPSTTPLTTTSQGATAGNVSLLTCQSSQFIDNSTNNFAITVFGESRPTAFSPFTPQYASQQPYTPSVLGGSMYFDGSGDFLTTPSSTAFGFGTGDFTVECWVYPTVNARQDWIDITNGTQRVLLYYSGSSIIFYSTPPNAAAITGPVMSLNVWTHLAVSKRNGSTRLFVNGIQAGSTYTTNQNYGTTGVVTIGKDSVGSTVVTGYMSNVRIVKGTGLYASNFVPQNAPLTAVTNTSLLLNATNAGIYDASTLNDFETVGNAQVSTSVKKYGTSSVALDGTGDYLLAPDQPYSNFGSGNFTIEAWIYPNVTGEQFVFSKRATSAQFPPILFGVRGNPLRIYFAGSLNGTTWGINGSFVNGSINIALSTWTHVALVRDGTTFTSYVNGVADLSFTGISGALVTNTIPVVVGAGASDGSNPLNGNIQDLRITNGIARYTATFTPPTAPLPDF